MPRSDRSYASPEATYALRMYEWAFSAPPTGHPQRDATIVWQSALHILRKQVRASVFDCYLKDSRALTLENDILIIVASTPYAKEFLQQHLTTTIARTVSDLLNRPIRVRFIVADGDEITARKDAAAGGRVLIHFLQHTTK